MLDVPPCNVDGFFLIDTNVAFFHMKNPIWDKYCQAVLVSNSYSILTGKECAGYSPFLHRWFCFRRYMDFFNLPQ
jgi:hypothetical protein